VVPLLDAFDAGYSFLANDGALFYFRTDHSAPRGRIIAVDLARPGKADCARSSPRGRTRWTPWRWWGTTSW